MKTEDARHDTATVARPHHPEDKHTHWCVERIRGRHNNICSPIWLEFKEPVTRLDVFVHITSQVVKGNSDYARFKRFEAHVNDAEAKNVSVLAED